MLAPAKAEGVGFVAGPDFMLEGGENSLRLSFASVPPDDVPEGIARLARALAASQITPAESSASRPVPAGLPPPKLEAGPA